MTDNRVKRKKKKQLLMYLKKWKHVIPPPLHTHHHYKTVLHRSFLHSYKNYILNLTQYLKVSKHNNMSRKITEKCVKRTFSLETLESQFGIFLGDGVEYVLSMWDFAGLRSCSSFVMKPQGKCCDCSYKYTWGGGWFAALLDYLVILYQGNLIEVLWRRT